jgi:hypothetical protein
MKDEIKSVASENLLTEMMKCKPAKITRIKWQLWQPSQYKIGYGDIMGRLSLGGILKNNFPAH